MNEKRVLDVTAGSRMMWFDKSNPDVVFSDRRILNTTLCDGRALNINPDIIADFTELPFDDESFYLVVFDPPHLDNAGENSWMAKKYGRLNKGWEEEIKKGFDECMRVLKKNGTLIFKWNESRIPLSKILNVLVKPPLFGHTTGNFGKTKWMTFMK